MNEATALVGDALYELSGDTRSEHDMEAFAEDLLCALSRKIRNDKARLSGGFVISIRMRAAGHIDFDHECSVT